MALLHVAQVVFRQWAPSCRGSACCPRAPCSRPERHWASPGGEVALLFRACLGLKRLETITWSSGALPGYSPIAFSRRGTGPWRVAKPRLPCFALLPFICAPLRLTVCPCFSNVPLVAFLVGIGGTRARAGRVQRWVLILGSCTE